jgi:hypothetical protein
LHREKVHAFVVGPGRSDLAGGLTPKGITIVSRTVTNTLIHAGGSPTVWVASTRMLYGFDELKSML